MIYDVRRIAYRLNDRTHNMIIYQSAAKVYVKMTVYMWHALVPPCSPHTINYTSINVQQSDYWQYNINFSWLPHPELYIQDQTVQFECKTNTTAHRHWYNVLAMRHDRPAAPIPRDVCICSADLRRTWNISARLTWRCWRHYEHLAYWNENVTCKYTQHLFHPGYMYTMIVAAFEKLI